MCVEVREREGEAEERRAGGRGRADVREKHTRSNLPDASA